MKRKRKITRSVLLKAGIRVIVGIPMERTIDHMAVRAFWDVAANGWPIMPLVYGRTDFNRNKMAERLLKSDYTHIVMLDADHLHPANIVQALARWVIEDPNKLVVAGLNFRRTAPYDPCIFLTGEDGKLHSPVTYPKGLVEVDATGNGCILISKQVFETLDAPWWAYPYNLAHIGEYPSEDMYFSFQLRQAGIKQYCDTTVTSPHIGQTFIDEQTFHRFIEANPELVQQAQ